MDVLVLGCGVAGLSCALRLKEAGYGVRVWARELPPHTTSDVAGAMWLTCEARPRERVEPWAVATLREFLRLASAGCGVSLRQGFQFFREPEEPPWWRGVVPAFRPARTSELPSGYSGGWAFTTAVVEMPLYLAWLMRRFRAHGGEIERRAVGELAEATAESPVVVNCTGLGARELVGDRELHAIRGQVVRVAQTGIERFVVEDAGPERLTYVIPRSEDCILGGTAEADDERLEPDAATARGILERCAALEPRLRAAQVLEHRVGLRPGRAEVRLESERRPGGGVVVHDYGHGGAGVTLSWGCADEVVREVRRLAGAG